MVHGVQAVDANDALDSQTKLFHNLQREMCRQFERVLAQLEWQDKMLQDVRSQARGTNEKPARSIEQNTRMSDTGISSDSVKPQKVSFSENLQDCLQEGFDPAVFLHREQDVSVMETTLSDQHRCQATRDSSASHVHDSKVSAVLSTRSDALPKLGPSMPHGLSFGRFDSDGKSQRRSFNRAAVYAAFEDGATKTLSVITDEDERPSSPSTISATISEFAAPMSAERSRLKKILTDAGLRQWIGRDNGQPSLRAMDNVMAVIACIDAILIGFSFDVNPNGLAWLSIHATSAVIFLLELLMRVKILGCRGLFASSGAHWYMLDVIILLSAIVDVLYLSVSRWSETKVGYGTIPYQGLRIGRCFHVWKLTRASWLPFLADLHRMVDGARGASRTLACALLIMAIPHYAFALMLRERLGTGTDSGNNSGAESFANVGLAFFNVFRCSVVGECTARDGRPFSTLVTINYGWYYGAMYVAAVAVLEFGLFNIICAAYVDKFVEAAQTKEKVIKQQRLTDPSRLTEQIQKMLCIIWQLRETMQRETGNTPRNLGRVTMAKAIEETAEMEISCEFFEELLRLPLFQEALDDLDVGAEDRPDLFDTLDVDGSGSLTIGEMLLGIAKLRGIPRRSDEVRVELTVKQVHGELLTLKSHLHELKASVEEVFGLLRIAAPR